MTQLSKLIDGAEKTRYELGVAISVTKEAAGYLDNNLEDRANRAYLAYRQDDVLNLFSAAFTFLSDAQKGLDGIVDLLYDARRAGGKTSETCPD
jgi:hypothetical protein